MEIEKYIFKIISNTLSIDFSRKTSFAKCQKNPIVVLSRNKSNGIHESEKLWIRAQKSPFISDVIPGIIESKSFQIVYPASAAFSICLSCYTLDKHP